MSNYYDQFFKVLIEDKVVVSKLIEIDNKVMRTNLTFDDYYREFWNLANRKVDSWKIEKKTLFVTEGSPLLTFIILMQLINIDIECILFINQNFVGVNKWLVDRMISISGESIKLVLDTDINYNKYIKMDDLKIVPLGEENLFYCVMEDFKNE